MSVWQQFARGAQVLFHRRAADKDLEEEVEHFLEAAAAERIAAGESPEGAQRAARLELGRPELIRDEVRSHGWENAVFTLAGDLRYAARQLRANPGFAIVAIVTLALGVGACTAIFSAVNPILFARLPYPNSNRIMSIWEMRKGGVPIFVSFGTFHGMQERSRSFEALAVTKPWQPTITSADQPERLDGQRVSAGYFHVLSLSPRVGRDFEASDDRLRGPNTVILSDGLWRRRFAADSGIVGRQIRLDDNLYTVIGVMPASFENVLAPAAQLWAPLQYDPSLPADGREWGHHLQMIGRLRPGISEQRASSELGIILQALGQIYSKGYDSSGGVPDGMIVNSLQNDLTRGVKPALLAILGAVGFVLLIACVNVSNLLLGRGAQRRGEMAMRAALGASQGRLVRQLLTESVLLAIVGGALGIVVASLGVRLLVSLSPVDLPRVAAISIDRDVFRFALVVTGAIGIVVGAIPAFQISKGLQSGILQASRRTTGSRHWTRRALVVSEVALACVLLVGTGLLIRSLHQLFAVDPGFDGSHVLTMQIQESGRRFQDDSERLRFFRQALDAVRRVPGVTSAGLTSQLPLSGDYESYGVQFERDNGKLGEPAFRYAVTPGYLETMRIPLRRGRLLNEHDDNGMPVPVLISESFAKRKFSGEDPIGGRIRIGPDVGHEDRPWATIVGVVGDVKQESLAVSEPDAFYLPASRWPWADNVMSLVVRTEGDAAQLAPAVRNAIWSIDKDQPIVRVASMDSLLATSEAQRRFVLTLFEIFGIIALVLAAVGIYGVVSGGVTERIREIGVRAALGASPRDIVGFVVRQGMTVTGLGIALGLIGAIIASDALITLLFGIARLDVPTYAGVIVLLFGVAGISCWIPAQRAARVDPAITLRAE